MTAKALRKMSMVSTNAVERLSGWFSRIASEPINPANAKKPPSLIYGVDDRPLLGITISNAIQQVCVISINLVYPIVVFRAGSAPVSITSDLLAIGMVVLAF